MSLLAHGILWTSAIMAQSDTGTVPTDLGDQEVRERVAINFQILKRREVPLGNRSIIFNRVAPPALEDPSPRPSPAESVFPETPFQLTLEPQKRFDLLLLSATVYDHRVTELRYYCNQHEYRVFSNIDFNLLAGASEIATDDANYLILMGIGNETSEQRENLNRLAEERGWPKQTWPELPKTEQFSSTHAEYIVVDEPDVSSSDVDLAALDALHVYYDLHREQLAADYLRREAERIVREQWEREHPPQPRDTIINYWPKKSRVYPTVRK